MIRIILFSALLACAIVAPAFAASSAALSEKLATQKGFKAEVSGFTTVLHTWNQQLRPQILAMKPGTRVVSHAWDMGEWEPDTTQRVGDGEAFMWIVPARVEGRWALRDASGFFTGELSLVQRFQRVGGTLDLRGNVQPVLGAYVEGDIVGFTFVALDGGVRSVRARVDGGSLTGSLNFAGNLTPLTGQLSGRNR